MPDTAKLLIAFLLAVALTGCGTIVHGTRQTVSVSSSPPGAKVTVSPLGWESTTPAKFELARDNYYTLLIEKPGFEPEVVRISNAVSGWVWGNIPIGVFWAIFDAVTGGAYELDPDVVEVDLTETREEEGSGI